MTSHDSVVAARHGHALHQHGTGLDGGQAVTGHPDHAKHAGHDPEMFRRRFWCEPAC